jgi:hypothetical protein
MTSFKNKGKNKFLSEILTASIDLASDTLASRCKFNFSYFTVQPGSQDFIDLNVNELRKLFEKLKEYSRQPLTYWRTCPIGRSSGNVFDEYGRFPEKSDFYHPKSVPHQAMWGRFRLESATRLCGFTVPNSYHKTLHVNNRDYFCSNTFYIVFFDRDHKFYKTNPK